MPRLAAWERTKDGDRKRNGPREERLANAAAALFASRGDSVEVREGRGGPLADHDDPDARAYAQGAALPGPGAKLAGPSFEEWLIAA